MRKDYFQKMTLYNSIAISAKMKLDPNFLPYSNINSQKIIDLNVKFHTLKLLEENIGQNLSNHVFGKDLTTVLNYSTKDMNYKIF